MLEAQGCHLSAANEEDPPPALAGEPPGNPAALVGVEMVGRFEGGILGHASDSKPGKRLVNVYGLD